MAEDTDYNNYYNYIRSGKINWLKKDKSNDNDRFVTNLPKAYGDLKLKNVKLEENMEQFVEDILIQKSFYQSEENQVDLTTEDIKERIDLLVEKINHLVQEYLNNDQIDMKFVTIAKFIATIIFFLKSNLKKESYKRLPWEEIEFCLVIFIGTNIHSRYIDIPQRFLLTKDFLLRQLQNFSRGLKKEDTYIENDINEDLILTYNKIRDNCSLDTITNYIRLALGTDPIVDSKSKIILILLRTFIVTGEHLKNTTGSRKLSDDTSKQLFSPLQEKWKRKLQKLRDNLSHSAVLPLSDNGIKEFEDAEYKPFLQIFQHRIQYILALGKCKTIIDIFKTFKNVDEFCNVLNCMEIKDYIEQFKCQVKERISEVRQKQYKIGAGGIKPEQWKNIESNIGDLCEDEYYALVFANESNRNVIENFENGIVKLKEFIDAILTSLSKFTENQTLKLLEYETLNVFGDKEQLFEKFIDKYEGILNHGKDHHINTDEMVNSLSKFLSSDHFKSDCQSDIIAIEMLMLSVFENLHRSERLAHNPLFSEDIFPLLIGRNLRNHLAHINHLTYVLLINLNTAIISNAHLLCKDQNTPIEKRTIGNIIENNLASIEHKLENDLRILDRQNKLFVAFETGTVDDIKSCLRGNIEDVEHCLGDEADVNGRDINLRTCLHFAAKGGNLETAEYAINREIGPESTCINKQQPKENIINYQDAKGQTPLHIAAELGYDQIVDILLKNEASGSLPDKFGALPLHYAIQNNHKYIARVLLESNMKEVNKKLPHGSTPLHIAARNGHLDLVELLLQNNADVKEKDKQNQTPLQRATESNNLEVIRLLSKKEQE